MTVTKSVRVFTSKMLAIAWRLNLTEALHNKYFTDSAYYTLNALGKRYYVVFDCNIGAYPKIISMRSINLKIIR